ncbi:MAG: ABC transporter ATP-binding protein [Bulleidia sp.]
MSEEILRVKGLSYEYRDGNRKRVILDNADAAFETGKIYSITGESGSGKTTFLYCIGGMDPSYKGEILYQGEELKTIGLEKYRRKDVSMVFQNYNLIPYLSALHNIYVAADISDNVKSIDAKQAKHILKKLGITPKQARMKVSSLSGGEQQRIAIARCIALHSKLIICDEPTGNLDYETGMNVMRIFMDLAHAEDRCVIMVTHNSELAEMCDVQYRIDRTQHCLIRV